MRHYAIDITVSDEFYIRYSKNLMFETHMLSRTDIDYTAKKVG